MTSLEDSHDLLMNKYEISITEQQEAWSNSISKKKNWILWKQTVLLSACGLITWMRAFFEFFFFCVPAPDKYDIFFCYKFYFILFFCSGSVFITYTEKKFVYWMKKGTKYLVITWGTYAFLKSRLCFVCCSCF